MRRPLGPAVLLAAFGLAIVTDAPALVVMLAGQIVVMTGTMITVIPHIRINRQDAKDAKKFNKLKATPSHRLGTLLQRFRPMYCLAILASWR